MHLPSGESVNSDDVVVVDLYSANRQADKFGEHSDAFDPNRQLPANQAPYGLTFGVGVHTCLGRTLAAGDVARAGADPKQHLHGTVTQLAAALLAHGARPDPNRPAQRDGHTARESWTRYDVLIG